MKLATPTKSTLTAEELEIKITNEVQKLRNMGCAISDDKLLALVTKKFTPNKKAAKRSAKKWAARDERESSNAQAPADMGSFNRANAIQNLPSSMRDY